MHEGAAARYIAATDNGDDDENMNEHFDGCAGMNEVEWKKILGSSLEPSLFGISMMEVRNKDTDEKVMIGNSETAECHSLLLLFLQIPDDSASKSNKVSAQASSQLNE